MASEEDITSQVALLSTHRRRLAIRLQQRAVQGLARVSPEVVIDILDTRQAIRNIKTLLKEWGADFPSDASDEEPIIANDPSPRLALTDLLWPDGSILVLIPVRLENGNALCLGKHPITNIQYRRFVEATGSSAPAGEHHRGGKWTAPFSPWEDPNFSADDQPVVCIPYYDAEVYCQWVNRLVSQHNRDVVEKQENAPKYRLPKSSTGLPTPMQWDYAAYGTVNPTYSSDWLNRQKEVVHSTFSTERIDLLGTRTTPSGIADMLGQVWEWCGGGDNRLGSVVLAADDEENQEVRGGAFLDNLFKLRALPALKAFQLMEGANTRHSDLGFRIAVEVAFAALSEDERAKVAGFPPIFQ